MLNQIRQFTDTTYFNNALKITIATVLPVVVFSYFDNFQLGFTIALGAFLTYPSDIPSSLKHKINGVTFAAFLIASVNLLINCSYPFAYFFYPFLIVLLFLLSIISVYGQRATMVSFSALLSLSLSFAHLNWGWKMIEHSGLLLLGGLFYLLISLIFHFISPNRQIELQLAECMRLTSKYLKLRGDLWTIGANRKAIIEKQLHLQVELNAIHQTLRDILINNHSNSGASNQNRDMIIVFISLVEIQELALSTSFDHEKLHLKFDDYPTVLLTYQNLAYNLSKTIKKIAKRIQKSQKYISKNNLNLDLNTFEIAIKDYESNLDKSKDSEGAFMLKTMLEYAEKQVEKIKIIERAYMAKKNTFDFKNREKDLDKFITPQYYPIRILIENLSFPSAIFRHSVRLTITVLVGFLLGQLTIFHNVYWILLTIAVIMRPGYGLTKQRSYHRIFGTIVGATVAFGILYLIQNQLVIIILTVISILLGFAFNNKNYKISATFVTIYIVFIYSLLNPDVESVIQYRIIDTLVGTILAFMANYLLWPSWEFLNTPDYLNKAILANGNYLNEISSYYNQKGNVSTSYRLARKNAFIAVGNLMASFQRMSQEPKSKQKQLAKVYKLAVLNHTVLSSIASLGTYIQSHQTTSASEAFNAIINAVIRNLNTASEMLNNKSVTIQNDLPNQDISLRFNELKNIRTQELLKYDNHEEAIQLKMQEAQLVIEQLMWLINLSENIVKNTESFISNQD
jgi:uncharacterized membrane protein (TIGR01666 family)